MDWYGTNIARPLADRIKKIQVPILDNLFPCSNFPLCRACILKIYGRLGYKSVSDFVARCVMEFLPREENRFEEIMEAIEHGTIKEGGDEGEL